MNIGIDFGSTYSMLSYYDPASDTIKTVQTQNGSMYIPSVACLHKNKLFFGQQAKDQINNKKNAVAFRAFKMLLNEDNGSRLAEMNYDQEYTPKRIAREFLKQQLINAKQRCNTGKFEKVVICIPQVWNTDIYTMSGKAILQEICMELKEEADLLDKVVVVSEPAAASAYFAYAHQKKTQEAYNERMLIVDYGGGTLDISLTKVSTVVREDGTTAMEIDIEGETGAGENHGNQIGDAGIAYLEGTVRLALADAGYTDVPRDSAFIQQVNEFESALINQAQDIQDKVQLECAGDAARMEFMDDVFYELDYDDESIPVTYSVIYRAYQQIIAPVLTAQLEKVKAEYLDPIGLDPRFDVDKLQLALVGGFGQFELVRQQVYEFFHIVRELEDGGREDAICYGAALIADGLVSLRKTAKLSIGLVTILDSQKTFDFAITKRMELEYDKVYYMPNPIIFGGSSSSKKPTWEFAIGRGSRTDEAHCLIPLAPTQNELNKIEAKRSYTFGFSVDESDIYSIHVIPTDDMGDIRFENEGRKIRLGNFSDIFGPTVSYRKTDVIKKI